MSSSIANQIVQLLPPSPIAGSRGVNLAKGRIKAWLFGRRQFHVADKPAWIRVSDRAWRRQSALIMCLHESRITRDGHG
jgi:hypothetical protein